MKSRLTAALAAVVLLGAGIAVAVGSLSDEAMVSKSYYEDVYLPALRGELRQRAEKGTDSAYQKAEKTLAEKNKEHLDSAASGQAAYTLAELKAGDALELKTGASLLVYDGEGRLEAGALSDVTNGATLTVGQTLRAAHRYIVTDLAGATVSWTAPGSLGYQGEGTVREGEAIPLPFVDVAPESWYHNAVAFVYRRGYFAGTKADAFSPNSPMNRAMVATVLHRMSGEGTVRGGGVFFDVPDGQWYTDGIAWASANGVVNGMGEGRYAPELAVTREQLVTMLYRYEKDYRKADVTGGGELSGFPDAQAVSSWAEEAVSWAVGTGLLQGRNSGELDPAGTATRAEVATILQRFSQRL